MKTIEITKEKIIYFLRLDLISEIQALKKSLELFEKKYGKSFVEFKKEVLEGEETFEKWDDYIEWEAYLKTYEERLESLKDLESAEDIKVVTR